MSEQFTPERLAELRRIAEAATQGPLTMHLCDDARYAAFVDAPHLGPDAPELAVFLIERDARFFAEFDRDTVLTMLGELERLRGERETLAAAVLAERALREHQKICHWAQMDKPGACLEGCREFTAARESAYKQALALLDGEKGGGEA